MATTPPPFPRPVTQELCAWIAGLTLADIPTTQRTRIKYLLLDGLACGLVGAHLAWSEAAVQGVMAMESPGTCGLIGHGDDRRLGPLAASLLNSAFIQGFELDDYHKGAPIHSGSIVLPTLLAAVEHTAAREGRVTTGADFLVAALVGYETGPRVGLGVHGIEVLSRGWHSGAIFGPAAAAAAASKLLQLPASQAEDALGMACTQAGGLMAAQYESTVKRMQHGFAARNGLFGALMARSGYAGIKQVLERPYGGFLSVFSQGNGRDPPCDPSRVVDGLGVVWALDDIVVKPHASMAATHSTIDALAALQKRHPRQLAPRALHRIRSITVEMSEPAFKKGGWRPVRPLTVTGAQMTAAYAAAMQLLEGEVQVAQFAPAQLDRDDVWALMDKIHCQHNKDLATYQQIVTVDVDVDVDVETTHDAERQDTKGRVERFVERVVAPRGNGVALSNDEVLHKWRQLTARVIDPARAAAIEEMVLHLETVPDVRALADLLHGRTESVFGAVPTKL
ncbi:hypothetical protein SCUCBS95973_002833 [Sporothrix curviconia]|uniref:MmgE/PrpD family protein n=1 Tax=Sporothrix curviconia TaxID=1260050 RepID=A0ABP0BBE8_9PEZI